MPDRVAVLWPGRPVPLRLDPLLLYREGELADEVLFLNRDRNGRQVEYLSYTTGEHRTRPRHRPGPGGAAEPDHRPRGRRGAAAGAGRAERGRDAVGRGPARPAGRPGARARATTRSWPRSAAAAWGSSTWPGSSRWAGWWP